MDGLAWHVRRRPTGSGQRTRLWVRSLHVGLLGVLLVGCGTGGRRGSSAPAPPTPPPPAEAAVVGVIESIDFAGPLGGACPGGTLLTRFIMTFRDGADVPGPTEGGPTVSDLVLESPDAVADGWGQWTIDSDPLRTALTGIRLSAHVRGRPEIRTSAVVPPDYACGPPAEALAGPTPGTPGPELDVRVAEVSTPFHERLLLVAIRTEDEPTLFRLAPLDPAAGAGQFTVVSQGRPGEVGRPGATGTIGTAPGGGGKCIPPIPGGRGRPGGAGSAGGDGGEIVIRYDDAAEHLREAVVGVAPGGPGGRGGDGGDGGGGTDGTRRALTWDGRWICVPTSGRVGPKGPPGASGPRGEDGPPAEYLPTPLAELFGDVMTPGLRTLLDYSLPPRQRQAVRAKRGVPAIRRDVRPEAPPPAPR